MLIKVATDIIWIEKKLDARFLDLQFRSTKYQYLLLRRARNSNGGRKVVNIGDGFIVKRVKNVESFEIQNSETIRFKFINPDINGVFPLIIVHLIWVGLDYLNRYLYYSVKSLPF